MPLVDSNVSKSPYLPEEVLVKVFSYYLRDNATTKLFELAKVCQSWNNAVKCPALWRNLDDIDLTKNNILALCRENCLILTEYLNLRYVAEDLKREDLQIIARSCPKLCSIDMSTGNGWCINALQLFAQCCKLKSLALQFMMIEMVDAKNLEIVVFLNTNGLNLTSLDLSFNTIYSYSNLMISISSCCPHLEVLKLSHVHGTSMYFPVSLFQKSCPKLRVLELGSVFFTYNLDGSAKDGFPLLQVFNCTTFQVAHGAADRDVLEILKTSLDLKELHIQNCREITHASLLTIPANNLQVLNLGGSGITYSLRLGEVLSRWKHSLRDIGLSNTRNTVALHAGLTALITDNANCPLEKLNLSSSAVEHYTVQLLQANCKKLQCLKGYNCPQLSPRLQSVNFFVNN